jgi:hypothetical protein
MEMKKKFSVLALLLANISIFASKEAEGQKTTADKEQHECPF